MTIQNAIIATLVYHDIFDYPLTSDQITTYLIGENTQPGTVGKELKILLAKRKISRDKNLFFLKGRSKITKLRKSRGVYSKLKLNRARFFSNLLALIPTIQLVAISGALSMENADKNDDIDLVIITAKNTLWVSRLAVNIILQPFRRKAGEPHTKDRACLNLFLEETSLKIGTQNLYTAHEIAQMKPLWQRQNAYQRFLSANTWVKNYLPNWTPNVEGLTTKAENKKIRKTLVISLPAKALAAAGRLALVAEILAKKFQLYYMKKKITNEKIGDHQLFFHPKDTQNWILAQYQKRLRKLKI